ncbi:hypothetical protein U1Q18_003652 [Sarracenia purpurea var. burkii]
MAQDLILRTSFVENSHTEVPKFSTLSLTPSRFNPREVVPLSPTRTSPSHRPSPLSSRRRIDAVIVAPLLSSIVVAPPSSSLRHYKSPLVV